MSRSGSGSITEPKEEWPVASPAAKSAEKSSASPGWPLRVLPGLLGAGRGQRPQGSSGGQSRGSNRAEDIGERYTDPPAWPRPGEVSPTPPPAPCLQHRAGSSSGAPRRPGTGWLTIDLGQVSKGRVGVRVPGSFSNGAHLLPLLFHVTAARFLNPQMRGNS